MITSKSRIPAKLLAAAYPVADLVIPIPAQINLHSGGGAGAVTGRRSGPTTETEDSERLPASRTRVALPDTPRPADARIEALIRLIKEIVEPDSWSAVGGHGTIRSNETTLSLVIRQTEEVHQEIRDLLDQLRRLQDVQVVLATASLKLSPDLLEDVKFETLSESNQQRFAILTNEQATELRGAGELQSLPRVTLFNGQKCQLHFGDEASGPGMLSLQPVVSGDGKAVRLSVDCRELAGANAESVLTSLPQLPGGTSILLEVTGASPAKATAAGNRTFVMVTSDVVIIEEAEALPGNEQSLRKN